MSYHVTPHLDLEALAYGIAMYCAIGESAPTYIFADHAAHCYRYGDKREYIAISTYVGRHLVATNIDSYSGLLFDELVCLNIASNEVQLPFPMAN